MPGFFLCVFNNVRLPSGKNTMGFFTGQADNP